EPLARLSQKYPGRIEFTIIGPFHRTDDLESLFPNTRLRFLPFIDPEKIPPHIAEFDIGVMPLFDTDLEKGKCASKALVYMAASVPAVCSRVGENKHVIQDGVNGFLASNSDEWILKLTHLIENPDLRKTLGQNGRKTVEERYATEVCYRILRNEVLDPLLGSRRKPSAGS
ncbi:MAG: glycosyltransferase, partial [Nitrospinaceae bacterium]|nr:glycosyltransferase family 4 protein [Nitrospinaceae bacterium]NIR53782.1 glycosyltransferase family 4 protein [Nitrospinaceae bacterium]NIS84192.1 glycosyltransferase family 4 protein [Nitrospinaceae bacterium]NIT80998.1 glycosyltransferase family 4 protein [Nitrospinaceae bacterium]NIU43288.1 glycosyltransferase family 4 protein [Nitrospinaceae bacterium]